MGFPGEVVIEVGSVTTAVPKSCPWCPGEPEVGAYLGSVGVKGRRQHAQQVYVRCKNERCPVAPAVYARNVLEAIDIWNRRPTGAPQGDQ